MCVCIHVYAVHRKLKTYCVCVFILSLLLLQPQPSLIISGEKVTCVPEHLLCVATQHPVYNDTVLFAAHFKSNLVHCILQ